MSSGKAPSGLGGGNDSWSAGEGVRRVYGDVADRVRPKINGTMAVFSERSTSSGGECESRDGWTPCRDDTGLALVLDRTEAVRSNCGASESPGRGGRGLSESVLVDRVSSASSAISPSWRLRAELFDEDVEADAACNEQADDNAESLSSEASLMAKMVSCRENFSTTA